MSLVEGRLEFLQQKYAEQIGDPGIFNTLIQADPTARGGQPGNYAQWIIIHYLKAPDKPVYLEDLPRLRGDLEIYNAHKARLQPEQRDINRFNPQTLFSVIEPLQNKPKNKAEMVDMGSEKLYHDDSVIVLKVKNRDAMVKLGRGTRWCVAADSDNGLGYYNSYTKDGPLVLIHFKDGTRYLMHDTDKRSHAQFMDANDHPVKFEEMLSHHPEPSKFKKFLAQFATIRMHAVNNGLYHEFHDKPIEQDPSHQIRGMVAGNEKSPLEKVRALMHDPHPEVRAQLARARREIEALRFLANDPSPQVRQAVASNPKFPLGDAIDLFGDDDDATVRKAILFRINDKSRDGDVSGDKIKQLLTKYLSDPDASIRKTALERACASGTSLPQNIAVAMTNDESSDIRRLIATNAATPGECLQKLAHDPDWKVREQVAINKGTPLEVLLSMVNDDQYWIGKALAQRSEPQLLTALADDYRVKIKTLVAQNPKTPPAVLAKLQTDTNQQVRAGVVANAGIEQNSLDPELWKKLVSATDPAARAKAAMHPEASPDQLDQLAADREATVRKAVALNPRVSTKTLQKLVNDTSPDVRLSVARNRGAAPELLQTLHAAETARGNPDRFVFINIAANPNTPAPVIQQLARSVDAFVLKGIAMNPKAPMDILTRLSAHNQPMVSTTATQTLHNIRRGT